MAKKTSEGGRILVVADPHIHNYSAFDQDGSRLQNCIRLIEELIERAKKEKITTIVCCGDWFDKPILHATVVNAAARVVHTVPEGMRIVTISGNHDMFSTKRYGQPQQTAVQYLVDEQEGRFLVFDDTSLMVGDDTAVYGIPYYDDPQEYSRALDAAVAEAEEHSADWFKILVIHQTPMGLDNTMIQTDTDPNDPRYDVFDLVLCGHIHTRQFITDKFVVVGTPIHRSAEDQGLEKGYFLVDTGRAVKGKPAKEIMEFVSTRGRYPEFEVVDEGEEPTSPNNFVTIRPQEVKFKTEAASAKDFGAGATPQDLVTAYWREASEGDEKLLTIGLKLLEGIAT